MTTDCKSCRKIIVKPGGLLCGGKWYCSPLCQSKDVEEDVYEDDEPDLQKDDVLDPPEGTSGVEEEDGSDVEEPDLNFDELLN